MSTDALVQTGAGQLAVRYELTIEELIAQVQKIQQVMHRVMKEGEHYGTIPGTPKPTLYKAGSEKLCLLFRLDPQYASSEAHDGKHLTIKSACTLWHIPTGQRWGSGEGSCSTKESKYAYRQSKRVCPKCEKETIGKSKYPPRSAPKSDPGGWWCDGRKGGCGAEFVHDDPAVVGQEVGRAPNEDIADQYNTVLKMANKRSLVAAVLNVTAASDIFTQDLEDLARDDDRPTPANATTVIDVTPGASTSAAAPPVSTPSAPVPNGGQPSYQPLNAIGMADMMKGNGTGIDVLAHYFPAGQWANVKTKGQAKAELDRLANGATADVFIAGYDALHEAYTAAQRTEA